MPSRDNLSWSPLACSAATREKCEAWLQRRDTHAGPLMETCSSLGTSNTSAPEFADAHRIKRTSVVSKVGIFNYFHRLLSLSLKCIGPSSPLLNTWATVDVQEAFYSAFCAEQACQASLLPQPYLAKGAHSQRNIGLELIILQSKMNRAQAEISLYTVAIGNAREPGFPDMTGRCEALCSLQILITFCRRNVVLRSIYSTPSAR